MKGTLVLLLGMIGSLLAASDLPRLRVEGDPILAGEKKIRLRGINRGWWNSRGTRYTEEDMKQLSERSANVLRLRDNPSGDNGSSGSEKRRQLLSGQSAPAERPEKSLGKESRIPLLAPSEETCSSSCVGTPFSGPLSGRRSGTREESDRSAS